ncbi:SLC13 family permease [Aestuariibacter sp. GS-14]|uniref:SLC13 family permease n=1 Tax=Aestuariibacter sp. GS-14 TaxID=2590670 RepID=UPI00112B6D11|nr:SLC13 family permease [Aestuariibacter sp. GS-14]TPV57267.1 SLC13 family permease [Aestuariibacter sp. GS-14]
MIVLSIPAHWHVHIVFVIIAVAALLMATNRVRYDMIAIMVMLALMLTGVTTVGSALSGFGNTVVVLIAGLLVVGEMLDRTGVARFVGDWIADHSQGSKTKLLIMLMLACAMLSAVMSSTAVVAIFIPIVMRIARHTANNPGKLLLPMSYAALVSGMLTLIATPPNLVISGALSSQGFQPLGFFSFSIMGAVVLAGLMVYMVSVGKHWLPDSGKDETLSVQRTIQALWDEYRVNRELVYLQIGPDSPLHGKTIAQSELYNRHGLRILDLSQRVRGWRELKAGVSPDIVLHSDDVLHVAIPADQLDTVKQTYQLFGFHPSQLEAQYRSWEFGAVSVLIHPESRLIGKTIRETRFRDRYGLDVFGVRRNRGSVEQFQDLILQPSDSLLVTGPWAKITHLQQQNHDFVVLEKPAEASEVVPAFQKMPVALGITTLMVLSSVFNWMPLVASVLIAALAAVVTRCLSAADAYRAIHWQSLVLLAGMLPLADALQQTGGTTLIVESLLHVAEGASPQTLLVMVFFITALLTNILSNTASAVLMAPIAISLAQQLGVSPYPLALTVLFAASAAFMTPIASPIVTLIVEPGKYRFSDFIKLGTPMLLWVFSCCYLLIPLFFPW